MRTEWTAAQYRGKDVYTGHWPKQESKAVHMTALLVRHGWCFPAVPVVDLGDYYQAVDGSHIIAACARAKQEPELLVVDARLRPDQPIPPWWEEILNAPLVHGRTIRGFGVRGSITDNHIGVVLDEHREMLRVEYVSWMFDQLLRCTRSICSVTLKGATP